MTDRKAMLRGIVENPKDIPRRLVYADQLTFSLVRVHCAHEEENTEVENPRVHHMGFHVGQMHEPELAKVRQVRWPWDNGM